MNGLSTLIAMLVTLSVLGALGAGLYLTVAAIAAVFSRLDPTVANVTAIGSVVALTAASIIARGIGAAGRRTRAAEMREERAATYQLLLDFWSNTLRGDARLDRLPPDVAAKAQVLERLLALYGSAAVINRHAALRAGAQPDHGAPRVDQRAALNALLAAVREDLGSGTPRGTADELQRLLLAPIPS